MEDVMAGPIDAMVAIHNPFRHDMELVDAAALESARGKPGLAAALIEQTVGDDWPELARHVPELVGAY